MFVHRSGSFCHSCCLVLTELKCKASFVSENVIKTELLFILKVTRQTPTENAAFDELKNKLKIKERLLRCLSG